MAHPKYPKEAVLRCACGKLGPAMVMGGHRGRSRNPLCREELEVVPPEQAQVALEASQEQERETRERLNRERAERVAAERERQRLENQRAWRERTAKATPAKARAVRPAAIESGDQGELTMEVRLPHLFRKWDALFNYWRTQKEFRGDFTDWINESLSALYEDVFNWQVAVHEGEIRVVFLDDAEQAVAA